MKIHILLVEDNPDHAVLVQAMLDYRGLKGQVYVAESVAEAKSYLLGKWPFDDPARHPPPHLVILDHWLDDGTGLDLLKWLKEVRGLSEIPVVVFTICQDAKVREEAESLGAAGFFLKPEGFDALGAAIDEIVRPNLKRNSKQDPGESGSAQAG